MTTVTAHIRRRILITRPQIPRIPACPLVQPVSRDEVDDERPARLLPDDANPDAIRAEQDQFITTVTVHIRRQILITRPQIPRITACPIEQPVVRDEVDDERPARVLPDDANPDAI